jgi:phospholipase D1/2
MEILAPGRNCRTITHAPHMAVLVDAASYYPGFLSSLMRARESVLILAWDIDSRVWLGSPSEGGLP